MRLSGLEDWTDRDCLSRQRGRDRALGRGEEGAAEGGSDAGMRGADGEGKLGGRN